MKRVAAASLLLAMLPALPGAGAAEEATGLRRWLGAEGGFAETACLGVGTGCPGFSVVSSFDGDLEVIKSMGKVKGGLGEDQIWPARTGNRFFLASVPAGTSGTANVSTAGSDQLAASPLTVTFGLRLDTPVAAPVIFYRHRGSNPAQTVQLAAAAGGQILSLNPGQAPIKVPGVLEVGVWHTLTITYGDGPGSPMKLYLDDNLSLTAALPFGGPSGNLEVGIVGNTTGPLSMGIDDYVEASGYAADIRGARVNYLMPMGLASGIGWNRTYPVASCLAGTPDWRLVSEDQHSTAGSVTCDLDAGALVAFGGAALDRFTLEGVPSRHVPSANYGRDLTTQPWSYDDILGVRTRMTAQTDASATTWTLGVEDQGQLALDTYVWAAGEPATRWGPTLATRPSGSSWTAGALNGALLRLESGGGPGMKKVFEVRLDYVWVPR